MVFNRLAFSEDSNNPGRNDSVDGSMCTGSGFVSVYQTHTKCRVFTSKASSDDCGTFLECVEAVLGKLIESFISKSSVPLFSCEFSLCTLENW